MIPDFATEFLDRSSQIATDRKVETFRPERFRRIMNGMTCEVAFGRALRYNKPETWRIDPPSTTDDMQGKDVTVREGRHVISIDLKNDDGFLRKLDKIKPSDDEREKADEVGYIKKNGVYIVNADQLGKIKDFEYVTEPGAEESAVIALVDKLLYQQYQTRLRRLSRSVINRSA